ncbi:MAG: septal ring lytic transglycosylase RlpA family protein [Terriglobales bacterium]
MVRLIARGLAIVVLVSLGAAQGPNRSSSRDTRKATGEVKTVETAAMASHAKPYQVGTASWYGDYFEGRQTASGEPYNMYDLTAAHPSLPLGTWVKVTNLRNREAVLVRINDRGPVVPGRIIDLSYSAAKVLHFKARGLQRVRLDIVHPKARPQIIAQLTTVDR